MLFRSFVPESRLELAPYNALYAFDQARAIGFSAFAVDAPAAGRPAETPALAEVYRILSELGDRFIQAQQRGDTRTLMLHLTSPRAQQTVSLDGYLLRATLARTWQSGKPLTADGALLEWQNGKWTVAERLNGDQSDQGRELLMDAHAVHLNRVRLYSYPRH